MEVISSSDTAAQLVAMLMYAASSVGIMFMNKLVLTSYGFPSSHLLGLAQYCCTLLICSGLKAMTWVDYPGPSMEAFRDLMPLPLLFVANALTGLVSTKRLNLPMFTVLRRFSILFTMFLEWRILKKEPSRHVQICVYMMILGSFVAAANDITFDALGYLFILMNDVFTALNGVVTKQKTDSKRFGEWGVLFHNTLYSMPVMAVIISLNLHDLQQAITSDLWTTPGFVVAFSMSSAMGCLIQYSTIRCTKLSSALTTTIIGCLKNMLTTYVGMMLSDYRFSWLNFMGLNISITASLVYSYVQIQDRRERQRGDNHRSDHIDVEGSKQQS